jgi:hypothetical protein
MCYKSNFGSAKIQTNNEILNNYQQFVYSSIL